MFRNTQSAYTIYSQFNLAHNPLSTGGAQRDNAHERNRSHLDHNVRVSEKNSCLCSFISF